MQRPRCSAKLPNKRASTCPTTRSVSILMRASGGAWADASAAAASAAASLAKQRQLPRFTLDDMVYLSLPACARSCGFDDRSEEHTSELQSLRHLVCRLLLEKKKKLQQSTCSPVRCAGSGLPRVVSHHK